MHNMAMTSYVTKISDRKKAEASSRSRFELVRLKNSFFNRGWIGVNKFILILISLLVCFLHHSSCSTLPKWAREEVRPFDNFTREPSAIQSIRDNSGSTSSNDSKIKRLPSEVNSGLRDNNKYRISNLVYHDNSGFLSEFTREIRKKTFKLHDELKKPKSKHLLISDKIQNYLMNFGYIPPSDIETGNLRTDEQVRDAIRNLQNFAHIPVTGELDENTLQLMRKPRCGLPDIPYYSDGKRKKRYTLHGQKWHYTNLTWSLRTYRPRNLDPGQVRSELHRALSVWSKHSKLTFEEINSDRADILVYFERGYHGDGYAFDGIGQILAHAFFPGGGRGGDAHFDEDEIWILDPFADMESVEGTSLFAVAAHEFGHSLGLSHSSVQESLMFPWYQVLPPNFELPEDDKRGIQQLYGAKEEKLWAKIPVFQPFEPRQPPRRPKPSPRPTKPPPTQPPPPPTPRTPNHPHPRMPTKTPGVPDTCDTSYDAISVIRGEVFIFKDRFLWRIGDHGLHRDYPAKIDRLWYGLPANFTHVDAVYERSDKKIVFFIGKMYYVFNANHLMPGYPKPLHHLGLPRDLDVIDAAMVWGHNGKTYFFSGSMYWRFDEEIGRVELDYPRDMTIWRGVGYNVDTVFQWKDGITYFFKGKGFWKFNDLRMRVENERQMPSAQFWMGCPRTVKTDLLGTEEPPTPSKDPDLESKSNRLMYNVHCQIATSVIFFVFTVIHI